MVRRHINHVLQIRVCFSCKTVWNMCSPLKSSVSFFLIHAEVSTWLLTHRLARDGGGGTGSESFFFSSLYFQLRGMASLANAGSWLFRRAFALSPRDSVAIQPLGSQQLESCSPIWGRCSDRFSPRTASPIVSRQIDSIDERADTATMHSASFVSHRNCSALQPQRFPRFSCCCSSLNVVQTTRYSPNTSLAPRVSRSYHRDALRAPIILLDQGISRSEASPLRSPP